MTDIPKPDGRSWAVDKFDESNATELESVLDRGYAASSQPPASLHHRMLAARELQGQRREIARLEAEVRRLTSDGIEQRSDAWHKVYDALQLAGMNSFVPDSGPMTGSNRAVQFVGHISDQVSRLQKQLAERPTPWTGSAEAEIARLQSEVTRLENLLDSDTVADADRRKAVRELVRLSEIAIGWIDNMSLKADFRKAINAVTGPTAETVQAAREEHAAGQTVRQAIEEFGNRVGESRHYLLHNLLGFLDAKGMASLSVPQKPQAEGQTAVEITFAEFSEINRARDKPAGDSDAPAPATAESRQPEPAYGGRLEICEDLEDLIRDQSEWSQATFGSDTERGPVGALRHLSKEALEAAENPHDTSEYADCLLLLLDAMRRRGLKFHTLVIAAQEKMKVNRSRTYPPSVEGQPCEHVDPKPEASDCSPAFENKEQEAAFAEMAKHADECRHGFPLFSPNDCPQCVKESEADAEGWIQTVTLDADERITIRLPREGERVQLDFGDNHVDWHVAGESTFIQGEVERWRPAPKPAEAGLEDAMRVIAADSDGSKFAEAARRLKAMKKAVELLKHARNRNLFLYEIDAVLSEIDRCS